jgi:hypothetical protein
MLRSNHAASNDDISSAHERRNQSVIVRRSSARGPCLSSPRHQGHEDGSPGSQENVPDRVRHGVADGRDLRQAEGTTGWTLQMYWTSSLRHDGSGPSREVSCRVLVGEQHITRPESTQGTHLAEIFSFGIPFLTSD